MKSNDQLTSLVSLEKSAQATPPSPMSAPPSWWTARPPQLTGGDSQLEPERHQAVDRHHHDQGFHGPDRIYRHRRRQSGHPEFHLGWPRQRRPALARWQLHAHRHSGRCEQPVSRHFNRGSGGRGFSRSHAGSAPVVDQRAELHARQDQTDCPARRPDQSRELLDALTGGPLSRYRPLTRSPIQTRQNMALALPSVTKRLAETGQSLPDAFAMLRQILSRDL